MKTLSEINEIVDKFKDFSTNAVFEMSDMLKVYLDYCKNIQGNKAKTGIASIDEGLGGIRPGELCGFIGATNVGKTSFAMQSAKATSQMMYDRIIPVICTEPTEIDMIERYLQIELDSNTYEVENICKDITFDSEQGQSLYMRLKKYENIVHVVKALKENELIPYIKMLEEITGKKAGYFIIDHIQGMKSDLRGNRSEKLEWIIAETKQAVNTLKIPGMFVSHVARSEVKDKKELSIYSGKGSGEIENSCQILFSIDLAEEEPAGFDLSHELRTKDNPHGKYKLLSVTPLKKKRGSAEKTFLLQNTKTTELTEWNKKPLIDF